MRKYSKKRSKLNSEYSKLRKEHLESHPICQAKIFDCSINSTDIHHTKGRGKYLNDTSTWLSVCRNCHNWIEEHPEEARELGFSKIRI